MDFGFFISVVISIFVMVDPFGNIPIFLGLTGGMSGTERRYVITKASVIATIILVIFALVGKPFLDVLDISINSLRIAGGILLLLIAFDMLMGSESRAKKTDVPQEEEDLDSISVTPMATPLIAGPGAMTLTMVYMNDAAGLDKIWVLAAIIIAMLGSWIIMVNSDLLFSIIHKDGTRVLTKVMGIVLAAIATNMMINGISGSFPGLLG
ncbi:MAG TPA: MarC family protein [Methanocella sp.]|uniref:MarC family protein n=1 Tax=Methanocella sp. TaxID=2052833 RepID=UPI002C26BA83|nr:MarC family protein [Methanocella sp.]HTY91674.1 MarC family protein [Methanocella sp.]